MLKGDVKAWNSSRHILDIEYTHFEGERRRMN